jgi:hypothetical protein
MDMGKLKTLSVLVCVLAVLVIFISCSTDDGGTYFVQFTADGQAYEFFYGPIEVNRNAFASIMHEASTYTYIGGTSVRNTSIFGAEPQSYIEIGAVGTTTGTYSGADVAIDLRLNGVNYQSKIPNTVTITIYGAQGAPVEGTFTADFDEVSGPGTLSINDGEFKVIRVTDDVF